MKKMEFRSNTPHGNVTPPRSPVRVASPNRPRMVSRVVVSPVNIPMTVRPTSPQMMMMSPRQKVVYGPGREVRMSVPMSCPQPPTVRPGSSRLAETMMRATSNHRVQTTANNDLPKVVYMQPMAPQFCAVPPPAHQLGPNFSGEGVPAAQKKLKEDLSTSIEYNMKDSKINGSGVDRCLKQLEDRVDRMLQENQEFRRQANNPKAKKSSFIRYLTESNENEKSRIDFR